MGRTLLLGICLSLSGCGAGGCPKASQLEGTWEFGYEYDGYRTEFEITIDKDGDVSLEYDGDDTDWDCEVDESDNDFCDLKVVCEYDGEEIELTLERKD